MDRTLVLGDIHGNARGLEQVLERSNFDPDDDHIIFLGDICDGWPEVPVCIDIMLSLPNRTILRGNHDEWALEWMVGKQLLPEWYHQGGQSTFEAYRRSREHVPREHKEFLLGAKPWHQVGNKIFVHGGFHKDSHPMGQSPDTLLWDRDLWMQALQNQQIADARKYDPPKLTQFDEVYVGHTSTWSYSKVPCRACEVWNMDQGAGWNGKLSIMDIDTKEFWQSDVTKVLYPGVRGRD